MIGDVGDVGQQEYQCLIAVNREKKTWQLRPPHLRALVLQVVNIDTIKRIDALISSPDSEPVKFLESFFLYCHAPTQYL